MLNPATLTDEQVAELRKEKIQLNRQSRRATGMIMACAGKGQGLLECRTIEGTCPDYNICRGKEK